MEQNGRSEKSPQTQKTVVIISGGMDSATLLKKILADGHEVVSALSFDYGQKHRKELEYARRFCGQLGVPHKIIDIRSVRQVMLGSALTDDSVTVPEGHYADPSMKVTVIPNRNMIMLSIAVAEAISQKAGIVFYGAHKGDAAIYPDCRPIFIERLTRTAEIAHDHPVTIAAPFLKMNKGDIAQLGKDLGVDFSLTLSCYKGEDKPCGKCGACVERREAMQKAGINED